MATIFAKRIQRHISKGWKIEAKKLGTRWDIMRLGVGGLNLIRTNEFFRITQWISTKEIEFATGSFVYRCRGDRKYLRVGDQLIGKETVSFEEEPTTLERYTVVGLRILQENICVRTDEPCRIFRPTQRTPLGVSAPSYNMESVLNDQIAAFDPALGTSAFYDQGSLPAGAIVTWYFGFTLGEGKYDHGQDLPYSVPDSGWLATFSGTTIVPQLQESDIIVDSNGDFFRVDRPYATIEGAFIQQNWCTKVRR